MARLTPGDLIGQALTAELEKYHQEVIDGVNTASKNAADKLTKKLKATAPKDRGNYAKSIGHTSTKNALGNASYTVGAKGSQGRLTHLLVHGHATNKGGRTKGNPFFKNAVDEVLPEYENEVKQVLEGGLTK